MAGTVNELLIFLALAVISTIFGHLLNDGKEQVGASVVGEQETLDRLRRGAADARPCLPRAARRISWSPRPATPI